jgi:hypothetical protein
MAAPLVEVGDPGRHPVGMEADPQDVDRRLEEIGSDAVGEQADGGVRGEHLPRAVDHDGRIRLVRAQDLRDRLAHRLHLRILEVVLLEPRREPGGQQHAVALAQRDIELRGEVQHHLGAGPRSAGLEEAHVPSGDPGRERQLELAHPASSAPLAQEHADATALR